MTPARAADPTVGGIPPEPSRTLFRIEHGLLLLTTAFLSFSIAGMEYTFLPALVVRLVRWARGEVPRLPPLYWAGAAALLAAWLAASATAPVPGASFPRILRLYHLLIPLVLIDHAADPRAALRLLAVYCLGVSAASVYGLADWWSRSREIPGFRLEGTFSMAMTSGNVFALATSGLWTYATQVAGRRQAWAGATAALAAASLVATSTRSSWLGAMGGAVVGVWRARRRGLALLLVLAVAATALFLPAARRRAAELTDRTEYTARGRISLWLTGWELFTERPWLGHGLADHTELIAERRRADATFEAGHFHSNPVQIAVATGAVGVLAYAFFHAAVAVLLWRRRSSVFAGAALAAWVAFHISGCFDWSFGDAEVTFQYFWWMGVGLGAAASR